MFKTILFTTIKNKSIIFLLYKHKSAYLKTQFQVELLKTFAAAIFILNTRVSVLKDAFLTKLYSV